MLLDLDTSSFGMMHDVLYAIVMQNIHSNDDKYYSSEICLSNRVDTSVDYTHNNINTYDLRESKARR